MRKYILPAIGAVAGLAIVVTAAMWIFVWRFQVTTQDAYVQADIAAIVTKLPGYVASIKVTDNQQVKAGDVLLELDTSDIKPKTDQASALVDSRKAAVSNMQAKLKLQQSIILQAHAGVQSARADADRARTDASRYQTLVDRGVVSKQRYDIARSDIARADAAVDRASAAMQAERDQVAVLDSALKQADADLKQADAQLALTQADLANATIRAPFDGIVGNRTVQTGQYVRAGFQLMAVVPLPSVYVIANFKETQIEGMTVGQRAEVSVDALSKEEFDGEIESFAPASGSLFSLLPPENATGNFTKIVQRIPVRIKLDGPVSQLAKLKAGMSVGVTVDLREPAGKKKP
ncbi:MAG: HlyD family secretion protein [Micropepsaceae bacterium]